MENYEIKIRLYFNENQSLLDLFEENLKLYKDMREKLDLKEIHGNMLEEQITILQGNIQILKNKSNIKNRSARKYKQKNDFLSIENADPVVKQDALGDVLES